MPSGDTCSIYTQFRCKPFSDPQPQLHPLRHALSITSGIIRTNQLTLVVQACIRFRAAQSGRGVVLVQLMSICISMYRSLDCRNSSTSVHDEVLLSTRISCAHVTRISCAHMYVTVLRPHQYAAAFAILCSPK